MTRQTTYVSDLGRLSDYFDSFFVGYDSLMNNLYNVGARSTGSNFPPADVIKVDDEHYRIDVAAAGFSKEEIQVEVADGVLTIKGEKKNKDEEVNYVHKKIAYRDFEKQYTLNTDVIVEDANYNDGILSVNLKHEIPEHKKPRTIEIG